MIPQGYDVRFAFPRNEGLAEGFMAEAGIPVDKLDIAKPVLPRKTVAFVRFAMSSPIALARIVRHLRRYRPDVIHVNGAFDILPALGGRIAGVPVVWHLNDTAFGPRLSALLGGIVKRVSDVVVVAATRVGEHYGVMDSEPHVIHAPVDVQRFAARDVATHPAEPNLMTLVGNWNWMKGQDRFVEALKILLDRGLEVRGLVAGRFIDGQKDFWAPILERIETEGLGAAIEAPGFVEDTPGVLAKSAFLLLTSHSEASPMAVLEAMSVGVPVVAFDVGGVREMLGKGDEAAGIIVPRGDVNAMADAVETLLGDRESYTRMSRNGQTRARDKFSLEACVERHKSAYAAAISKKGKSKQ